MITFEVSTRVVETLYKAHDVKSVSLFRTQQKEEA